MLIIRCRFSTVNTFLVQKKKYADLYAYMRRPGVLYAADTTTTCSVFMLYGVRRVRVPLFMGAQMRDVYIFELVPC